MIEQQNWLEVSTMLKINLLRFMRHIHIALVPEVSQCTLLFQKDLQTMGTLVARSG